MSSEDWATFLLGCFLSALLWAALDRVLAPELSREELYRFCLVKNIKLEDCVIPERRRILHGQAQD